MDGMTKTDGPRRPAEEAVDRLLDQGFLDELMDRVDEGGVQLTGEGGFLPELAKLVPKGQRRVGGLTDMIISLYSGGMTVRDIQAHLERTLGTELSHETIANITDAVAEEVKVWQARPLEPGRFLVIVANHRGLCCRAHRRMAWFGVWSERQSRGRSLSSAAMESSSSAVQASRSVPFGRYCRSRPLAFSVLGRCQGECGSAK